MTPPVNRSLRFRILTRDDFACQYCGARPPNVVLEVDHIIPKSKGGQNHTANLVTACYDCNHGKRDRELSPAHVALFSRAMAVLAPPKPRPTPRPPAPTVRKIEKPKRVMLPCYDDGGGFMYERSFAAVPVGEWFPYIGDSGCFVGHFLCSHCGMYNTYEGDHCSCARVAKERYENGGHTLAELDALCQCGEYKDEGEELCATCYDNLYVYCWYCGEKDQLEDEDYCADCLPKFEQPR